MAWLSLQIRTVPRGAPAPVDDEAEGERLVAWVRDAVAAGSAPPVVVVLRPERTEIVGLRAAIEASVPIPRFVASFARSAVDDAGPAYAVGVIGVVRARRRGDRGEGTAVPMAVVFLEWGDNRWWYWRALLADDGRAIRAGTELVARAVDGDPMPEALGRWWALARRENLGVRLTRQPPDPAPPGTSRVH